MDPVLYRAARSGKITFLETLTAEEETRYFSQLTPTNNTLLHVSAEFEQAEFFKKVCLKCDASLIWQPNSKLETPLHVAARVGCLEIVRFLIIEQESFYVSVSQAGRRQNVIRQKNKDGDTALNCAVRSGHKDVVECLMEKDPELSCSANYVDESPLYLAVSSSFIDIAMLIIRLSPSSISYLGPKGLSPLHAAISAVSTTTSNNSVLEMIEEVIKKRPEMIKAVDNNGWTPFHYAAFCGEVEAVKILLKCDTDSSAPYLLDHNGNSALHLASLWGGIEVMKELIKSCPDIYELTNKKAQTALHVAVINDRIKVVKYILSEPQLGRLLNEPDEDGNTPLHLAVLHDLKPIIEVLAKDKRVNINATNKEFKAPGDIYFLSYRKPGFTTLKIGSLFRQTSKTRYTHHFVNVVVMEWHNRTPELKPLLKGHKEYKDQREKNNSPYPEVYLLVATIITTVSFSAAFTLPGGYISEGRDKGKPIFADKAAFKAFVVFDTIAFCFSFSAVYIQRATATSNRLRLRYRLIQTKLIGYAMRALALAFASGLYVTLSNANLGLSVIAYVMISCLFLLYWTLWSIDPLGARNFIRKRWAIGRFRIQLFRSRGRCLLPVCACSVKE